MKMHQFEEREAITLNIEGSKIFGIVHRPLVKTPCPAVFFCHGFAGNKCGKDRIYVNLSTALSQAGIASLRIDFRGCGDSEGDITETTIKSELDDALLGLHYLESLPFIDKSRIGILGRSLGGAIAVLATTHYPKTKSLALWAPLFHAEQWEKEWIRAQEKMKNNIPAHQAIRINGQIAGEEFVHQIFKMRIEDELKKLNHVPLLHVHGERDAIIKIDHADHYMRCRHNSDAKSEFIRLPHGDHDFAPVDVQKHAIEETCRWFKETL